MILQEMQLESDDAGAIEVPDDDVWQSEDEDDDEDGVPAAALRLHPRDLGNFMKLCKAIKILVSEELTVAQVKEADGLLRAYCIELLEVRSMAVIHYQIYHSQHRNVYCSCTALTSSDPTITTPRTQVTSFSTTGP